MSKVSCKAAGKRRRRLLEWRGLKCLENKKINKIFADGRLVFWYN